MPKYLEYQKSVAAEFKAYENRVRNLIDNNHWGEEGRFKEIILMNYLKRVLPNHISVGTGFVRNNANITKQIDIIIYDNYFPLLFSEGDFIIATPENVIGIIEVKSKIEPAQLRDIIDKSNDNAKIICGDSGKHLFNGIFSYNSRDNNINYIEQLEAHNFNEIIEKPFYQIISDKLSSCVNHIALSGKYFIKLWPTGQREAADTTPIISHYSVYEMTDDLAIPYFLSNLQEFVIRKTINYYEDDLPEEMKAFLYPLPKGKEANLIKRIILEKKDIF